LGYIIDMGFNVIGDGIVVVLFMFEVFGSSGDLVDCMVMEKLF